MTRVSNRITRFAVAVSAGVIVLFVGEQMSPGRLEFTTAAEARIGRPMTPMSYAGVARRTTRRAVGVGVGVGAAGAVAVGAAAASACYQEVDAYGRVYTRCP
jgi:hypothetical protein